MLVCAIHSVCFLFPNSVYPVLARTCRKRRKRLQTAKRNWETSVTTLFPQKEWEFTLPRVLCQELKWVYLYYSLAYISLKLRVYFSPQDLWPLVWSCHMFVFLHSGCDSQSSATHRLLSRAQHWGSKCKLWSIQRCALTAGSVTWPVTTLDTRCVPPSVRPLPVCSHTNHSS